MRVAVHGSGGAWEWRCMEVAAHGSGGAWLAPSFCQTHPSVNPHPLATSTLLQTHPLGNAIPMATPSLWQPHPSGNPIPLLTAYLLSYPSRSLSYTSTNPIPIFELRFDPFKLATKGLR